MKITIVDIPENRVTFFGGSGKMLLPDATIVAKVLQNLPEDKLITTKVICKLLSRECKVQGTCPVTTKKALQALAHDSHSNAPYWRVLKNNGELMASFPDVAKRLQQDGFKIEPHGNSTRVQNFKEHLFQSD